MNSINTFSSSGRAFIESELIEWDGTTTTAPFTLNNVRRGIDGTTAAAHTATNTVYNSWIHEMIETMSSHLDASLPNYDPFGDVRSPTDLPPKTIELLTRKLTLVEAFQKLGVQRSDRSIQKSFLEDAEKMIGGLNAPEGDPKQIVIEPTLFSEALAFGSVDVLGATEAFLAKPGLDPHTASIANVAIKFYGEDFDQRRDPADLFAAQVEAFIYWSNLHSKYILRSLIEIDEGTTISYLHNGNRLNTFRIRRAVKKGSIPIRRG